MAIKRFSIALPLHALLVTALVVCGASAGRSQSSDKIVVKESYPSKVASFWPNYVASSQGFYAKEGLDVQDIIVDPNVTVSTLIGNSVDMSYADSTQLLLALQKGAALVAVGLQTERNPYSLMSSPSVKTLADLKGKRIGAASEIDVYTYVVKQILRKAKIDPDKDVDFIYGGGQNQRLTAAVSGAIQAGLFSPPSDAKLRDLGFNTLAFAPDYAPNLTLSMETVRKDFTEQHPDELRKILHAQMEAVKWLNNPANKAQALQILETQTGASPADAGQAYDYYIGKHIWSDACIHVRGMVAVSDILHTTGQLTTLTSQDVPKYADTRFCSK